MASLRRRRMYAGIILISIAGIILVAHPGNYQANPTQPTNRTSGSQRALDALETLSVKGRASKTGYSREQFGGGWAVQGGCDVRNIVLARDLREPIIDHECKVVSGILHDPYSNKTIHFVRGASSSSLVQIDHVVALSDAWQKGAQQLSSQQRMSLANDPLNLLAVSGKENQAKSGSDAASWLPPHKPFRCQYISRQIAVKQAHTLWVTQAEYNMMKRILKTCPEQQLPQP